VKRKEEGLLKMTATIQRGYGTKETKENTATIISEEVYKILLYVHNLPFAPN
jgi:hypothetical protein